MKSLYDFDIYYSPFVGDEMKLENIILIDENFMTTTDGDYIKVEYIQNEQLKKIVAKTYDFKFKERKKK